LLQTEARTNTAQERGGCDWVPLWATASECKHFDKNKSSKMFRDLTHLIHKKMDDLSESLKSLKKREAFRALPIFCAPNRRQKGDFFRNSPTFSEIITETEIGDFSDVSPIFLGGLGSHQQRGKVNGSMMGALAILKLWIQLAKSLMFCAL